MIIPTILSCLVVAFYCKKNVSQGEHRFISALLEAKLGFINRSQHI